MRRKVILNCVLRSFIWYWGNLGFGIIPVIFMGIVYAMSKQKIGLADADKLIHEGAILFVCCANMGSVLLDFLQSGQKVGGKDAAIIYIAPIMVVGLLCLIYLFVTIKIVDSACFDVLSPTSVFVVAFSFSYCVTNKTILLIIEKLKI